MKKPSLLVVILYGMCAVIWTVKVIVDIVYKTYNYSVFVFVLGILCALMWIYGFFTLMKRYRSNKDK